MATVQLIWATPTADALIAFMARGSNPENQNNPNIAGLLKFMMREGHVSPFEMVNACVEITTTRDIARQILRHRSFSFQEFCIAGSSEITLELPGADAKGKRSAYKRTIEHLYNLQEFDKTKLSKNIRVFDENSRTFVTVPIKEVFKTGVKPTYKITLENGKTLECTKEHKFLTSEGFVSLESAIGLEVTKNGIATMSKSGVAFACNGMPAYRDKDALRIAKEKSISDRTGLNGICEKLDANINTVRKWLRINGLQFTKLEVSSYTSAWNKGKSGYSTARHTPETIAKMRNSARKGKDSNLWRGGVDRPERLKITAWCASRRSDFLRKSNYKCERCDSNLKLELHHMLTVAERPDLAYDPSNIEVLCSKCHKIHHGTSEQRKAWREKSKGNTLSVKWSLVKKIEYVGEQMTYDLEVDHISHNYVANGIVTHNSQRYASTEVLPEPPWRECRVQDTENRQNSLVSESSYLNAKWQKTQEIVSEFARTAYAEALKDGIAKEQARALLPEGITTSRMYMNGNMRSWIHYLQSRLHESTQKEHRLIADQALKLLRDVAPVTMGAFFPEGADSK